MPLVSASSLALAAPSDLIALQPYHRPAVGPTVRVYAVGDIGLSGRVRRTAEASKGTSLFADVAPLLQEGDLAFGNLEFPFIAEASPEALFTASPSAAQSLADSGFTILHVANNHMLDYGEAGLEETLEVLYSHQLIPLGGAKEQGAARSLVRTDAKGLRIGWLGSGWTSQQSSTSGPYVWDYDPQELIEQIRLMRDEVETLIVSLHLGFMYLDYPHPDHRALAELLVQEGVALVLMHHAHVLQGVQVTDIGGVICYNLGNFILDWQEGNVRGEVMVQEQQEGAVFAFDLDREGVCRVAMLPTWIDESCRVRWATGQRGEKILNRLRRLSNDLDEDCSASFWHQRSERNTGHALKVFGHHLRRGHIVLLLKELRKMRFEHVQMLKRWMLSTLRKAPEKLLHRVRSISK